MIEVSSSVQNVHRWPSHALSGRQRVGLPLTHGCCYYTFSSVSIHVAPHLSLVPASCGSISGLLPGGWTMVRSGLHGVRGRLGTDASVNSRVSSHANDDSMMRRCV